MKSFKKIALGVVAAITMSTLVATPASAAPMTVAVETHNGSAWATPATAGTATTTAVTRPVPADNSVDLGDAIKFVATVDTGTAVTVVATNAFIVEAVATSTAPVTASSGASTWTKNVGTGTTATFYVYSKTTAIGTVAITNGGTTLTYYVQGTVGLVNSISLAGVDSAAAGTAVTLTATVLDVFGNKRSATGLTAIANGATLVATTATSGTTLTDFGTAEFKFTAPATGPVTVVVYLTDNTLLSATYAGFNVPSNSVVKIVSVRDLTAELAAEKAARAADKVTADAALAAEKAAAATAALKAAADLATANAEIAKLKADAATANAAHTAELAKVKADNAAAIAAMKNAFNSLATKWNKKNPKAKVALVK
jgi:flagellin